MPHLGGGTDLEPPRAPPVHECPFLTPPSWSAAARGPRCQLRRLRRGHPRRRPRDSACRRRLSRRLCAVPAASAAPADPPSRDTIARDPLGRARRASPPCAMWRGLPPPPAPPPPGPPPAPPPGGGGAGSAPRGAPPPGARRPPPAFPRRIRGARAGGLGGPAPRVPPLGVARASAGLFGPLWEPKPSIEGALARPYPVASQSDHAAARRGGKRSAASACGGRCLSSTRSSPRRRTRRRPRRRP